MSGETWPRGDMEHDFCLFFRNYPRSACILWRRNLGGKGKGFLTFCVILQVLV